MPEETAPWVAAVKDGTLVSWRSEQGVRSCVLDQTDVPTRAASDMALTSPGWRSRRRHPVREGERRPAPVLRGD